MVRERGGLGGGKVLCRSIESIIDELGSFFFFLNKKMSLLGRYVNKGGEGKSCTGLFFFLNLLHTATYVLG